MTLTFTCLLTDVLFGSPEYAPVIWTFPVPVTSVPVKVTLQRALLVVAVPSVQLTAALLLICAVPVTVDGVKVTVPVGENPVTTAMHVTEVLPAVAVAG